MRAGLVLVAVGLGLVAFAASLRASFAADDEGAFDSPAVKQLAEQADGLKIDDEIALMKRIQRSLDTRLLTPQEEAWRGFEDLRGRTDAGLARILHRGLFEGMVSPRGGGCYWSFTKRSNNYNDWPQIELQQGKFSSGFYGSNFGYVVRLESAKLLTIREEDVSEELRLPADQMRERRSGRDNPKAEAGGVYVVRAVMDDECDVLAVFQVVALDSYGATIAWRVLKTYDVPHRKR
jgi:hypothetical protein